jgi:branched-chain amino acid transport system substrate-binding protein
MLSTPLRSKSPSREGRSGVAGKSVAASLGIVLLLSGCAAGAGGSGVPEATEGVPACGLGTGDAATGAPIDLGGIVVNQPGVDFSQITTLAAAYFECVNDNGGINGHPVNYIVEEEQTDPQQVSSLAVKLLDDDGVLAMVGNASLIDCTVNADLYEERGIKAIVAGVPPECFTSPSFAPVNFGPYYASIAAGQALVEDGVEKVVVVTADTPGAERANSGTVGVADKEGLPSTSLFETVPLTDPAGLALRLVDEAGAGGGVVVNFAPPELIKLFAAIAQQGLIARVNWTCVSCIDASIVESLGAEWDGKLKFVSEFNLATAEEPDSELYRQVSGAYAPDVPLGSFGQMGFLSAFVATEALLGVSGDEFTVDNVNAAIQDMAPVVTDLLCEPWYYGDFEEHVPNSSARLFTSENGQYLPGDCIEIAALPSNNLDEIRANKPE